MKSNGQIIGSLIGHLMGAGGALLALWAVLRFLFIGNAPNEAVVSMLFVIWGSGIQSAGKIICWFAGEKFLDA